MIFIIQLLDFPPIIPPITPPINAPKIGIGIAAQPIIAPEIDPVRVVPVPNAIFPIFFFRIIAIEMVNKLPAYPILLLVLETLSLANFRVENPKPPTKSNVPRTGIL